MGKVVVLHSGGLDSTVLLYNLHAMGHECFPLSIVYGQRHAAKETRCALHLCKLKSGELFLRHKLLDLTVLRHVLRSALTSVHLDIPLGGYSVESQSQTVVPNRNMILLSVAVGYAQSISAGAVAYAAHSNDRAVYPDCRPEFVDSVGRSIELATDGQVELLTPFVELTKADIILRGVTYRVPLELTYSCYNGRERHCGICGTCHERREAFRLAGVADPTEYEEQVLAE